MCTILIIYSYLDLQINIQFHLYIRSILFTLSYFHFRQKIAYWLITSQIALIIEGLHCTNKYTNLLPYITLLYRVCNYLIIITMCCKWNLQDMQCTCDCISRIIDNLHTCKLLACGNGNWGLFIAISGLHQQWYRLQIEYQRAILDIGNNVVLIVETWIPSHAFESITFVIIILENKPWW